MKTLGQMEGQMEGQKKGRKDRQTLVYRTLPASPGGPIILIFLFGFVVHISVKHIKRSFSSPSYMGI